MAFFVSLSLRAVRLHHRLSFRPWSSTVESTEATAASEMSMLHLQTTTTCSRASTWPRRSSKTQTEHPSLLSSYDCAVIAFYGVTRTLQPRTDRDVKPHTDTHRLSFIHTKLQGRVSHTSWNWGTFVAVKKISKVHFRPKIASYCKTEKILGSQMRQK